MAIEIVDLPIKNGGFLQLCKRLPEGNPVFFGSHCIPVEYSKEGHGGHKTKAQSAGRMVPFADHPHKAVWGLTTNPTCRTGWFPTS